MNKAKTAKASPEYSAQEQKWRTESDLRTMQEAAEIQKDPKRMGRVRTMAKEKLAELQSISKEK